MVAIREASDKLRQRRAPADIDLTNGGFGEDLRGHNIYILTNPCPMCAAAMGYCGADAIVHATTRAEYREVQQDRAPEIEVFLINFLSRYEWDEIYQTADFPE